MGLWLLQRVLKERRITDLPALIAQTEALPACRFLINPNDDRFINPDDMHAEIQAACRETDQPVPVSDAELARCIFDSLALLYADILHELANLRGRKIYPTAYCRRRMPKRTTQPVVRRCMWYSRDGRAG